MTALSPKSRPSEAASLSGPVKRQVFWSCLTLQASWNEQRMQNLGLVVALVPWLRRQGMGEKRLRGICRRYYGYFNTNPYLAGFVIGGLLNLESAGTRGKPVCDRQVGWLRDTLAGACGALGDQLFWLGLRPAFMMAACLLAVLGLWVPVLLLLAGFTVWQLWWRWRSLAIGFALGLKVHETVGKPAWHRGIAWARRVALTLTGVLTGVYFAGIGVSGEAVEFVHVLVLFCLGIALPILVRQKTAAEVQLLLGLACLILISLILP